MYTLIKDGVVRKTDSKEKRDVLMREHGFTLKEDTKEEKPCRAVKKKA